RAVRDHFATEVDEAVAGGLVDWEGAPRSRLALILLLDQFTRNLYRGEARTYHGDARAQRLAIDAFDRDLVRSLSLEERNFFIMPLAHAEDLALQQRAVALVNQVVAEAPAALRPVWSIGIEQSRKYRDLVARFGRFPHRNAVLGRTSTPE